MPLNTTAAHAVDDFVNGVRSPNEFGPAMARLVRGLTVIEGGAAAVGESGEAVTIAAGVAETLLDLPVFAVVLAVVAFLALLYYLVRAFASIFRRIPWVGGSIANAIYGLTDPLSGPVNWATGELARIAGTLLTGFAQAVSWAIGSTYGPVGTLRGLVNDTLIKPIRDDVSRLFGWNTSLEHRVQRLEHETGSQLPASKGTVIPLHQTVYNQQALITLIQHDNTVLQAQIRTLAAQLETIQDDYEALKAHVVGVRAVNVGWQDVNSRIEALETDIVRWERDISIRVDNNTVNVTHLLPLGLLVQAGAQGLNNLRTLEDNICQCPRLPGVINELGLAMSVLHHVKGD